jgi:hypothetical protein
MKNYVINVDKLTLSVLRSISPGNVSRKSIRYFFAAHSYQRGASSALQLLIAAVS